MTERVQERLGSSRQRGFWLRCFLGKGNSMKRLLLIVLIAAFMKPEALLSQWVCMGNDGEPCTDAEVFEMVCKPEKASANLSVAHPVRLVGTFLDPTGAPLNFDVLRPDHRTIVQIKSLASDQILYAVPLRANGEFEFESVPAGDYRLIVWMKDGKFNRLPLADQPKGLYCSDPKECRIRATITFHGTDNPVDWCPPK